MPLPLLLLPAVIASAAATDEVARWHLIENKKLFNHKWKRLMTISRLNRFTSNEKKTEMKLWVRVLYVSRCFGIQTKKYAYYTKYVCVFEYHQKRWRWQLKQRHINMRLFNVPLIKKEEKKKNWSRKQNREHRRNNIINLFNLYETIFRANAKWSEHRCVCVCVCIIFTILITDQYKKKSTQIFCMEA